MTVFKFNWPPENWRELDDAKDADRARALENELRRELSSQHLLCGLEPKAIAVRLDQDDVLFAFGEGEFALAVVHLTWRNSEEPDPRWPRATTFRNWNELEEFLIREFMIEGLPE